MKKILYVVSTLKRSGPTNQLYNLVKHLDRNLFDLHLITLSAETEDSRWKDFENLGVNLYSLNLSRIKGFFLAKKKVKCLIQKIKPDLIHTQGIRADVMSSQMNLRIPKLCTVHNYPQQDYVMRYGKLQGLAMLKAHLHALKKIDLCVGVSKSVERNLNSNYHISNTTNIKNGVDTELYHVVSYKQQIVLRNKLKLPKDAKLWVSSGHLSELKDPLFLIENWYSAFGNVNDFYLVLLGGGPLQEKCAEFSANMNNVLVKGRVTNVVEFLQASDYFVSCSKAEGLPMAVIEALGSGLPCILSDISPHAEIFETCSSPGALYELGDSGSFKSSLKKTLNFDYHEMQQAALNLIENNLSATVMANEYQAEYLKLLNKK